MYMKSDGKTLRVNAVMKGVGALLALSAVLAGCATLPDDGKDAKVMRFDNLNNYRYCELFLIGGDAITKDLKAAFYNSTELNGATATNRDSCPQAIWDKVDPEAIKKEYKVLAVFKNGPRYWMYDWIELPVGAERDFEGYHGRWMGVAQLPKDAADLKKKGSTAYKPTTVHRESKQGYAKGQTIFILDDPNGTPWIMQAYSRIVDKNLSYDDLKTLEQKLKLAPGWKYRSKLLDQDLGIGAINGVARIVQDDLENTYNACFEEAGQKNCTSNP
jgi:hypothetical protein